MHTVYPTAASRLHSVWAVTWPVFKYRSSSLSVIRPMTVSPKTHLKLGKRSLGGAGGP